MARLLRFAASDQTSPTNRLTPAEIKKARAVSASPTRHLSIRGDSAAPRCGCQLSQRKYFVPQPFVRKLCHHDVTVTIIAPTRDIPWTAANIPSARTHRNLRGARPNEGFDRGEQDADK